VQSDCKNDSMAEPDRRPWLDRLGIGVSVTCAIHCIGAAILAAAPAFAASAAPGLSERLEWLEGPLLWAAMGIGIFALLPAYLRTHRNPLPMALFAVGMVVLGAAHFAGSRSVEILGTVLGVVFVTSSHFLNLRSSGHDHSAPGHAH
jgi:MerC mercury resistance protein